MSLRKAHKALFPLFLWVLAACGDPGGGGISEDYVGSTSAGIVGGWAATTEQIFATVEIRRTGAPVGFCSGALVAPLVVVTAAHCAVVEPVQGTVNPASPGTLSVAAGHLTSLGADQAMIRSVKEVRVHEDYDHDFIMGRSRDGAGTGGMGSPHDIALLILSRAFEEIPNAPMLSSVQTADLIRHGDIGFVAGYGVYDLDAELSGELYITDAVIDVLGERELLTRRPDQMGDSCYGDSGGPFYVPTEKGDFLVGMVSRGRSDVQRECGDGGVYTLLSAYLPWIEVAAGGRFQPRVSADQVSFRADDAQIIARTKGGALRRASSCTARSTGGSPASSVLVMLAGLIWLQRRLSR